jgi:hypothetical protein
VSGLIAALNNKALTLAPASPGALPAVDNRRVNRAELVTGPFVRWQRVHHFCGSFRHREHADLNTRRAPFPEPPLRNSGAADRQMDHFRQLKNRIHVGQPAPHIS